MYVLAIDGGGTKTSAVICDEHGCIYAKVITSRSNPTAMDAKSFELTIHNLLQKLQAQNPQIFAALHSCFAGMAGVKERQAEEKVNAIIRQYVDKTTAVVIENDALIALYAGTLGQEGIVQIAGTGAITMGYDNQRNYHRVGGWGYLFDDEGSGYDLGIQALKAVFQSYDQRAKPTALTDVLLQHFSMEHVPQLIESIYGKGHPRSVIAPLSRYVFQVADQGDAVANSLIQEACVKYYTAIKACYDYMTWEQTNIPVVLAGGVFSNRAYFVPKLEQLAAQERLPLHFISPILEPIGGAAVGAFNMENIQLDDQFVQAFQENYARWHN
ncbi:N-acetylglucosamine kinase [Lysinibacillus parviboronicapiens]|uniref:N-acetylglucosamine kinase-like BadF-type ATPase n=1 Tax=Lysinibacillus parviboronicapiens TaxID=436516 RepID=A0ABV2PNK9_9BACI|nr:BadF/BadG/BcrA/BcrD ATPase family protein [Lysinibacillus parviboronicapiens]